MSILSNGFTPLQRVIHLSLCVVYFDLPYYLSIITNKVGYKYPSQYKVFGMHNMHLHGFVNRRVTLLDSPSPDWRYHTTSFYTNFSTRKCKWTLNLTVVHTHSHVIAYWRVKDSSGFSWRKSRQINRFRYSNKMNHRWTTNVTPTSYGPIGPFLPPLLV